MDPPTHTSFSQFSQGTTDEIPTNPPVLGRDPSARRSILRNSDRSSFAARVSDSVVQRDPNGPGYKFEVPQPLPSTRVSISLPPPSLNATTSGGVPLPPRTATRVTSAGGSMPATVGEDEEFGDADVPPPPTRGSRRLVSAESTSALTSIDHLLEREPSTFYPNFVQTPANETDEQFFDNTGEAINQKLGAVSIKTEALNINSEVNAVGGAWRGALRRLMQSQYDEINALMMSRILQIFVPFLTGHEALICVQVIEALDCGEMDEVVKHLKTAMKNRNVSRIIVSNLGMRYDWLWHLHTWLTHNRLLDGFGQFPVVGITGFPASENFPATRNHALASIFRVVLGESNWITRVVTGGREGLVTDDPQNTAQNLAAESNGFELANNSQYGTTQGRNKTNEFRHHHRLPTDESLVRTFITSPQATTVNNGIIHVLLGLSRHWHNMLGQPWGNFAHQRMEQLDPFETLRFHVPNMLLLMTNLRGCNKWDGDVLGPFVKKLQTLRPSMNVTQPIQHAKSLAIELKGMLPHVCSGVKVWLEPFESWVEAIIMAFDEVNKEADAVFELLSSVEVGIRVGFDCMLAIDWNLPSDAMITKAISTYVKTVCIDKGAYPGGAVTADVIVKAMNLSTPRDKRTLIELIRNGQEGSKPAQLLLARVKTLSQREIRRKALDKVIRERSIGERAKANELKVNEWYWLGTEEVYACVSQISDTKYKLMHVASNVEEEIDVAGKDIYKYNLIAESINRAQKAYMSIELYHGRRFKYNAFMEFPSMRVALMRLMVVGNMFCEELNNSRVNVLKEIQRSVSRTAVDPKNLVHGETYYIYDKVTDAYRPFKFKKGMKVSAGARIVDTVPQSVAVIGGGPTGLMTTLHCTENCLASDGVMKLYEARDAFGKGGSTFERAQIVRLDPRWIAMMRYHLGTTFENIYVSLAGETDAQLGNTLPTQGFVEITIKDLENMLHEEITRLWSKGLLNIYTESKAQYDSEKNMVLKEGSALKVGDLIKRDVDNNGNKMEGSEATWRVTKLIHQPTLPSDQLAIGNDYGVYVPEAGQICPFKLIKVDYDSGEYGFRALDGDQGDRTVKRQNSPSIYPIDTPANAHGGVVSVVMQCTNTSGARPRDETLLTRNIARKKFALDVGFTHVVEAIGKPKDSAKHLCITTYEPYGVACLQGLKVSYGMHNFGEKRFGNGLLDDIRSINDQNTRIIGDFTKMVRVANFIRGIYEAVSKDKNWEFQFAQLVNESKFPLLNVWDPLMPKIVAGCRQLADDAPNWRRKTVQTRFFETGDNYYLGMEFTREYDAWKEDLGDQLVSSLRARDKEGNQKRDIERFRGLLLQYIDRLWYEGVLESIRKGDVYNPGARKHVPRLYLINSHIPQKLNTLPELEAFRLVDQPSELYEIVMVKGGKYICRTVEGYIQSFSGSEMVKRESNLTRGPDGNAESKVSLAAFPVGHYVNHRTMVKSKGEHVFAFVGDEQSTPHFMRYSGLTGACVNSMSFNAFLGKALQGVDFKTRWKEYSQETQWSNGEVVQRGTGANYGEDGFLRPGFPYRAGIDYLWDKLIEYQETGQDTEDMLSYDWKVKFASALVPRGLEYNDLYLGALKKEWHKNVLARFLDGLEKYPSVTAETKEMLLKTNDATPNKEKFWAKVESDILPLQGFYAARINRICQQCIDFAQFLRSKDLRISSALWHQTKPVDVIVDDFAVEAQNVANSLTQSAALAAATLGLRLVDTDLSNVFAATLAGLNIVISFGTMTNIARYKTRNEEARIDFFYNGYHKVEKAVFSLMSDEAKMNTELSRNPFYEELETTVEILRDQFKYYNIEGAEAFDRTYEELKRARFETGAIRRFQQILLTDFLAVKFYVNSYIQQSLVDVYKTTQEILTFERPGPYGQEEAKELFQKLKEFKPRLQTTLQEGAIRWGFVKKRKIFHWDLFSSWAWMRSLLYRQRVDRRIGSAPVEIETRRLGENINRLSVTNGGTILHREQLDFETLFWAHRESQVASMVFVSAFLVFVSSVVFTIGRIFRVDVLVDIAFWAAAPSTMGALLAAFHLFRKYSLLSGLLGKIKAKKNAVGDTMPEDSFRVVMSATRHQMALTFVRFITAITAAVTLPWAVGLNQFEDDDNMMGDDSTDVPSLLGAISVLSGIFSVLYFFAVEYVIRYNLPVDLGPFVCRIISDEIASAHAKMRVPPNGVDSSKKEERDHWHYTARKVLHEFRFDTVFAADRFGQILQTIQGGIDPDQDRKPQTYV